MATDNVQRPFADILAASLQGVTHLGEVSVFESRAQEPPETVSACCAAVDDFFPPAELIRFATLIWRSLEASDIDLKAALVRDFPLFYLEVEKVVNTSALSFSKSATGPAAQPKPRLINTSIPLDLAKMGQAYPELGFYLRFFIDSSSVDLLSLDGKRRLLGLSWNYHKSSFECVCVKRGDYLVWHDPEHLNESMVVALMKADIGQTKGHLVGDDVEIGPGFECLLRINLRLRPLGLASVSFSAMDLRLELEDLTETGILASLRMLSLEGLLGVGTRLLALEKEITESFRVRAGVVQVDDSGSSKSLLGVRARVSAKQSSIMSWWSAFLLNRVVRAGVCAEALTLLGNLLRAFCSDLRSHLPRTIHIQSPQNSIPIEETIVREVVTASENKPEADQATDTIAEEAVAVLRDQIKESEGKGECFTGNQATTTSSTGTDAPIPDSDFSTMQVYSKAIIVRDESASSVPYGDLIPKNEGRASAVEYHEHLSTFHATDHEYASKANTSVDEAAFVSVESNEMGTDKDHAVLSSASITAPSQNIGMSDESGEVTHQASSINQNLSGSLESFAAGNQEAAALTLHSEIEHDISTTHRLEHTTRSPLNHYSITHDDSDAATISVTESLMGIKPKTRHSLSDETTVRDVQSFLETIEDTHITRK